jgi:hypothetical protein
MKILGQILLTLLVTTNIIYSQPKELKNTTEWKENQPLNWDNFKGPIDRKSSFYAETSTGIHTFSELKNQNDLIVHVMAYFYPKKSWNNKKGISDELLKHEQNHFDLSEVYARLLIKKLSSIESKNPNKIIQTVKSESSKSFVELKKKQAEYDKDTNHSKLKDQQEQWNTKVKDMLLETNDYNKNSITFKIELPVRKK